MPSTDIIVVYTNACSHKTHKYTVWERCEVHCVNPGGNYTNHQARDGRRPPELMQMLCILSTTKYATVTEMKTRTSHLESSVKIFLRKMHPDWELKIRSFPSHSSLHVYRAHRLWGTARRTIRNAHRVPSSNGWGFTEPSKRHWLLHIPPGWVHDTCVLFTQSIYILYTCHKKQQPLRVLLNVYRASS